MQRKKADVDVTRDVLQLMLAARPDSVFIKSLAFQYEAAASAPTPMFVKDEVTGAIIQSILEKYPQHKRILYFKAKFDNNEIISSADLTELKKFEKLLLR